MEREKRGGKVRGIYILTVYHHIESLSVITSIPLHCIYQQL